MPEAPHAGPWRGSVSAMKKLINAVDNVVTDALRGMAAAHPHELAVDLDQHIVYRRRPKEQGKVAIISGGGSGHEPLHGGFVGTGMLDAACAGEIFTSPVPDQMVAATSAVDRGAGVLHIVKNYTGDVMNFEMAAEIVDADSGIQVASVVTNDDVAVEDSLYTAGRRGVGVTVMVEKIAGAAAEQGRPLEEVAGIAARVNAAGRSMGMALTSCTVPANGKPSFDLPDDEMEIGIGIHGEPGRHREQIAPPLRSLSVSSPPSWLSSPRSPSWTVPAPTRASLPWSTAWAPPRCSSSISCTGRSPASLRVPGSPWPATSWATTSPASTWPAAP